MLQDATENGIRTSENLLHKCDENTGENCQNQDSDFLRTLKVNYRLANDLRNIYSIKIIKSW